MLFRPIDKMFLVSTKAKHNYSEIEKLNERIGIPNKLLEIKEEDLLEMTKRSLKEAHPMYPVPRFLSRKELINIYREIM